MQSNTFLLLISLFVLSQGQFYGMDYGVRRGSAPGNCPTYEQVKGDMILMKQYTNIVRLYNLNDCNGGNFTVRAAKELGMKVFIGLQNDPLDVFYWEISIFENLHKELGFLDFVVGAAVGCESLHRNDLAKDLVASRIVDFRNFTRNLGYTFPVGTADTPGGFNNAPAVRSASEIMLINIFAYYSGTNFASATDTTASDNLINQFNSFKRNNPNKIIEIGETGWPTSESKSGQNGLTILKWHMNQFVCRCWKENISLYWFQSFDQPFKGENKREGTWGIWNDARQIKINMTLECPGYPYVPTPIPPSISTSTSSSTSTTAQSTTVIVQSTTKAITSDQPAQTSSAQVTPTSSTENTTPQDVLTSDVLPVISTKAEEVRVLLSLVFTSSQEFDSAKFSQTIANLLEIPSSRINVISAVSVNAKRQETNNIRVDFEILPSEDDKAPKVSELVTKLEGSIASNTTAFSDAGFTLVGSLAVSTVSPALSSGNNNINQPVSSAMLSKIPSLSLLFAVFLFAFL